MNQFTSINCLLAVVNILNSIFCNPIQLKSVCITSENKNDIDLTLVRILRHTRLLVLGQLILIHATMVNKRT